MWWLYLWCLACNDLQTTDKESGPIKGIVFDDSLVTLLQMLLRNNVYLQSNFPQDPHFPLESFSFSCCCCLATQRKGWWSLPKRVSGSLETWTVQRAIGRYVEREQVNIHCGLCNIISEKGSSNSLGWVNKYQSLHHWKPIFPRQPYGNDIVGCDKVLLSFHPLPLFSALWALSFCPQLMLLKHIQWCFSVLQGSCRG